LCGLPRSLAFPTRRSSDLISSSKSSMAPPDAAPTYDFRAVAEADLPVIAGWLASPHAAPWWGDPATEIASIREHIDSDSVEPLIDRKSTRLNSSHVKISYA